MTNNASVFRSCLLGERKGIQCADQDTHIRELALLGTVPKKLAHIQKSKLEVLTDKMKE